MTGWHFSLESSTPYPPRMNCLTTRSVERGCYVTLSFTVLGVIIVKTLSIK